MLVLDIVIIYLACGAPFAVAAFLDRAATHRFGHALTSFAAVLYWPLLVPTMLRRAGGRGQYLTNSPHGARSDSDSNEERLRSKLLDAWSRAFGSGDLQRFRETLERYAGLSLELGRKADPGDNDLMTIAGHPDPMIGHLCRVRLNRQKLELHRTNARMDFIDAIDILVSKGHPATIALAAQLAATVGDHDAVQEIEAFAEVTSRVAA